MQTVVAHMGGADELAFVAVPLAITAVLLWVARRRAADEATTENDEHGHEDEG